MQLKTLSSIFEYIDMISFANYASKSNEVLNLYIWRVWFVWESGPGLV